MAQLPLVKNISPEYMQEVPVVYGNRQASHMVRAVAASYGAMRSETPMPGGRFLDEEDVRLRRRVAFIGSEVQRKLFGNSPAIGETIRVKGIPFEVIGVGTDKVQMSNYNRPDKFCVFVPWTVMSALADAQYVSNFVFQAVSPTLEDEATAQVREFLANRYRYDAADERALNLFGSTQVQQITGGIVTGLRLVLTFIGVLTLAIGGVGIMNIMFVNVQERTREIGVRKALGAPRREILMQFLLEGIVTTVAGGSVGIAASYALVWLLSPRPFLAELLDDASRDDGHSPGRVARPRAPERVHPDGGGGHRRAAARAEGVASRSDRGAAVRIALPGFRERRLQPVGDGARHGRTDGRVRQRAVFVNLSGRRLNEQVVHPGHLHDIDPRVASSRPCELLEPFGIGRRHLRVEQSLDNQHRLPDVFHRLGRIERQEAPEPGDLRLAAQAWRNVVPSLSREDRLLNAPLQVDGRLLSPPPSASSARAHA